MGQKVDFLAREIRTKRLLLVPHGIKYLETTHEYATDPETTRYMLYLPNDSLEETIAFLQSAEAEWNKEKPEFYEFAILFNQRHIGGISIYLEEEEHTAGELGWILHKDFWGQGIATEAAEAMLSYGREMLGLKHFIAHCDSENIGSYKVMEKIGMKRSSCYGGRKNKASDEERMECLYELWIE